jgi:hypothetical protein
VAHGTTDDDIELLTPNAGVFGTGAELELIDDDGDDVASFDDEPRSPWTMVVAGLLVLALIVVGVVAAAPWQDDDVTAVTVPTTVRPPVTTSPATTPDGAPPATAAGRAGWIVEAPAGWGRTAFSNQNGPSLSDEWLDVWASPGAEWATGEWLAVHTSPFSDAMLLTDATRLEVAGRTVVMSTDGPGITTTQVRMPPIGPEPTTFTVTYDIRSHGLTLDRLVAFISAFEPPVGPEPADLDPMATGPLEGLAPLWSGRVQSGFSRLTGEIDTASIVSADGGRTGIGIATSELDRTIETVLPVLYQPVATVPLAAGRPASATVTVWRDIALDDRVFATWTVGDTRVTALGYRVDLTTFVDALATATPATDEQWAELADQPLEAPSIDDDADLDGTLADGTSWSGVVSPQQLGFSTATTGWAAALGAGDGSVIRRFTAVDVDAVLAMVPVDDSATQLVITLADGSSATVPLVEMGDTGRRAGLWADTSLTNGPVAAQLLDATGTATHGEVLGPL